MSDINSRILKNSCKIVAIILIICIVIESLIFFLFRYQKKEVEAFTIGTHFDNYYSFDYEYKKEKIKGFIYLGNGYCEVYFPVSKKDLSAKIEGMKIVGNTIHGVYKLDINKKKMDIANIILSENKDFTLEIAYDLLEENSVVRSDTLKRTSVESIIKYSEDVFSHKDYQGDKARDKFLEKTGALEKVKEYQNAPESELDDTFWTLYINDDKLAYIHMKNRMFNVISDKKIENYQIREIEHLGEEINIDVTYKDDIGEMNDSINIDLTSEYTGFIKSKKDNSSKYKIEMISKNDFVEKAFFITKLSLEEIAPFVKENVSTIKDVYELKSRDKISSKELDEIEEMLSIEDFLVILRRDTEILKNEWKMNGVEYAQFEDVKGVIFKVKKTVVNETDVFNVNESLEKSYFMDIDSNKIYYYSPTEDVISKNEYTV